MEVVLYEQTVSSVTTSFLAKKANDIELDALVPLMGMATTAPCVSARAFSAPSARSRRVSRSTRCDACRRREDESSTGRRHAVLLTSGAVLSSVMLFTTPASQAYGFGNAPPPKKSKYRSEEEIRLAREDAERRKDARDAESNRGVLVTLPSGVQYRELDEGKSAGDVVAQKGDTLFVMYTVYRLAPGAYFKYSSGGTPIFMWARGYGTEGQDDVGATYKFVLGDKNSLPRAVSPALLGMKQGGKRRVLVPPGLGWIDNETQPRPPTFGSGRRLSNHKEEPLLMEVDCVRIRKADEPPSPADLADALSPGGWGGFKLPAPPRLGY